MKNWFRKILGIADLEFKMDLVNRDLNKAFNRIEHLQKKVRLDRKPMRYDKIERLRKRRKKAA